MTTMVSLLGGLGVLPDGGAAAASSGPRGVGPAARLATLTLPQTAQSAPSDPPGESGTARSGAGQSDAGQSDAGQADPGLPADSGTGRRVVFDMSDQRVWLVDPGSRTAAGDDGDVERTYLVSGSLTENLSAGTFEVYSRSRWAVGIDDSGVMQYFVRFTRGANAAIGFHSIPTKNGRALQTPEQLGTPQSHGCIRQELADAQAMWAFAPVGTKVVVTA